MITFEYILIGTGWAKSTISTNEKNIFMSVSYLSDALRDLTKAVVRLFEDSDKEEVFFMSEPGEHRISLAKKSKDTLSLKIEWFDDWFSWDLVKETTACTLLEEEISFVEFAKEVEKSLTLILDKYGVEGYVSKWIEHQFPYPNYLKLKTYLENYDGK